MEFRDYAATETSALLGRLLSTHADGAVQQLRILREALDAAARAAETAAADAPRRAAQEVDALASKLGAAAAAELQRVDTEARSAIGAARAELETQQSENQRLRGEHQQLSAALAEAREQEARLRADLQREAERADTADRDLDATIDAHKQVDAARLEAEAACRDAEMALRQEAQRRAELEIEMRDLRGLVEAARTEAARLSDQLESEAAQGAVLGAERDAAAAECVALSAQLSAAASQYDSLSTQHETVSAQHALAVAQLEGATERLDGMAADLEASRARIGELEAAAERLDAMATDLEASRARIGELEGLQGATGERVEELQGQLAGSRESESSWRELAESAAADLDAARARVQALEADQAAQNERVAAFELRLAESAGAEASVRDHAAATSAELDRTRSENAALSGHGARLTSLFETSLQALDTLGHATNLTDLLASLVTELAAEFPRVALFRVKGSHVEGEHQRGFDMTADVAKLMIPLNVDSLITRAATTGAAAELTGAELSASNNAPFGGTPATALALPIGFQGETLAVAYLESDHEASEHGRADHAASAGFARLLVRHTAVLVTRLSQELKMLAELRDYASMLLQEADQMYSADVEAGKSDADRRRRLQETIDCARQLYAQRAALEGAAAATLLDEQIAQQIESATPFARDLAAVAGHDQPQQSRRNAS